MMREIVVNGNVRIIKEKIEIYVNVDEDSRPRG